MTVDRGKESRSRSRAAQPDEQGSEFQLCNLFARQRGLDPIGYAGTLDALLAFEVPLPWPRGIFESRSKLPPAAHEALAWFRQDPPYRLRPLIIGPDPEYTLPGMRRVLWLERPAGPIKEYEAAEYLVPVELLGDLVSALVRNRGSAEEFSEHRRPYESRDLLVCTHGTQDAACGRYGVPLYRKLRSRAGGSDTRVWRVSHYGGHVFAPNVLELPSARFWAYLEDERAEVLLDGSSSPEELRGNYRGWAALEGPFLQALERELLVREGWGWLELPKTGRVVEQDASPQPQWAEVEIEVWREASSMRYRGRVETGSSVPIRPRSDSLDEKPYAQYQVVSLRAGKAEAAAVST